MTAATGSSYWLAVGDETMTDQSRRCRRAWAAAAREGQPIISSRRRWWTPVGPLLNGSALEGKGNLAALATDNILVPVFPSLLAILITSVIRYSSTAPPAKRRNDIHPPLYHPHHSRLSVLSQYASHQQGRHRLIGHPRLGGCC